MSDNAVAVRKAPEPSKALAEVMAQQSFAGDSSGLGYEWYRSQPAAIVAEAKALLPAMERFLAPPANGNAADRWLRRLRGATVAITDLEFKARFEAVSLASGDLPAWVWTDDALREACRTFKFFPTSSEVDGLLRPRMRQANLAAIRLKMLAAATPRHDDGEVVSIGSGVTESLGGSLRAGAR